MGVKNLAADRRAPDRRRDGPRTSPSRWSSAARCPASAPSPGRWPTSPTAWRRPACARRRSRWSARWRACARSSPGSSAGRCSAARVVVTRARAQASGLAARLAELGARGGRDAGDPDRAAPGRRRDRARPSGRSADYALVCVTSPNGASLLLDALDAAGATPARSPARRWRPSAPAPRPSCAAAASAPTSCPSARWPRRWSRRSQEVPVEGRRVLVARAAEARDVLPDALARPRRRGRRAWPLYDTVAEPLGERELAAAARRRLRDVHLLLHGALLPRRADGRAARR